MRRLITAVTALVIITITGIYALAATPPDQSNPYVYVGIDNVSGTVLRDTSSVRASDYEQSTSFLVFYSFNRDTQKTSEEIFTTGTNQSYLYVTKDQDLYHKKGSTAKDIWVESKDAGGGSLIKNSHLEIDANMTLEGAKEVVKQIEKKGLSAFVAYVNGKYRVRMGNYSNSQEALSDKATYEFLTTDTEVSYSVISAIRRTDYTSSKPMAVLNGDGQITYIQNFPDAIAVMDKDGNLKSFTVTKPVELIASENTDTCMSVVNALDGKIIFEYDNAGNNYLQISAGNENTYLYHRYTDSFASNPNVAKMVGGDIIFKRDQQDSQKRVGTINYVQMQDYVLGVITKEIYTDTYGNDYNSYIEAFKAHSILERNVALTNTKHNSSTSEIDIDVCDTTNCQVYCYEPDITLKKQLIFDAAEQTKGMFAVYNDGGTQKLAEVFYHSTNGGGTLTNGEAWYVAKNGVYVKGVDLPYVKAVIDEYDRAGVPSWLEKNYRYTVKYSKKELRDKIYNNGANNSNINEYPSYLADTVTVESGSVTQRNAANIPLAVELVCDNGKKITFSGGDHIRSGLGLRTPNIVDIVVEGDYISFITEGYGHNVGLSGSGMYARSKAGHTAEQIIKAYFDVEIKKVQ